MWVGVNVNVFLYVAVENCKHVLMIMMHPSIFSIIFGATIVHIPCIPIRSVLLPKMVVLILLSRLEWTTIRMTRALKRYCLV